MVANWSATCWRSGQRNGIWLLRCRWITDEWKPCTVTCGGGVEQRSVYCVRDLDNGTVAEAVSDQMCPGTKPAGARRCSEQPCPVWFTGMWSLVRLSGHSLPLLSRGMCRTDGQTDRRTTIRNVTFQREVFLIFTNAVNSRLRVLRNGMSIGNFTKRFYELLSKLYTAITHFGLQFACDNHALFFSFICR